MTLPSGIVGINRITRLEAEERVPELEFAVTCVGVAMRGVDPRLPEAARLGAAREQIAARTLPAAAEAQDERQVILECIDWALTASSGQGGPLDLCLGALNGRLQEMLMPKG